MRRLAILVAIASLPALLRAQYRVVTTFPVGGDGGWDYVVPDPADHRIFIGRQTRVMVVDENDGKLLGEVPDIHGAHGTAIAEKSGHGFATSGNDSSIVMFDLKTFKVLGRVHAAEDADAILYDPVPTACSPSTATRTRRRWSIRIRGRSSRTFRSAASPSTACRAATAWCTPTSRTSAKLS